MDNHELLLRNIEQERTPYVDGLLLGHAKDYADYRYMCGVLRGLGLAREVIEDLAKRQKDADNE